MIRLIDNIWIGNSDDGSNLAALKVGAVLNVAQDLCGSVGWPNVEYMQVGLIDGPGNPLSAYHAAILALATLLKRHDVLIYCHTGSRSLAIVLMYLNATALRGWDNWLTMIRGGADIDLPVIHESHKKAFNKINWRLLASVMEG